MSRTIKDLVAGSGLQFEDRGHTRFEESPTNGSSSRPAAQDRMIVVGSSSLRMSRLTTQIDGPPPW